MKAKTSALSAAMQAADVEFSHGSWAEPGAQRIIESSLAGEASASELLAAHLQLARQYRLQHRLTKSKQNVDRAKAVLDGMQPSPAQRAAWHLESGALAMATESFTKAGRELRLAFELDAQNEEVRCELYGFESEEGSYSAAVRLARTFEHSTSYRALSLTAARFLDDENDELAVQYFQQAVERARSLYGEGHAYTGHALLMLALCFDEQRKGKLILAPYQEAAAILQTQVTPDHPWREMAGLLEKRVRKYRSTAKPKSPAQKAHQSWGRALDRLRKLGGVEVTLGQPATEAQLQAVEKRLKHKLPRSYRDVLLHFAAEFETMGDQPGIGWNLAQLAEDQQEYLASVATVPAKAERTVWRNRLCVVASPGGGDAVVLDLSAEDGAAYYFACHREPELHGRRLAANFADFVTRAMALGCLTSATFHSPYEEFLGEDGLDVRGAPAKACRKRLGLA